MQLRKAERIASSAATFEAVALELHATKADAWSESHSAQWLHCLKNDLFPWLGSLPLAGITAPVLLVPLKKVQALGAVRLAHDLREFAGQVFRYGIATGRCAGNPAADLRGALAPYTERHMAAVLEPAKASELLRAMQAYVGQPATRGGAAVVGTAVPAAGQRPGHGMGRNRHRRRTMDHPGREDEAHQG